MNSSDDVTFFSICNAAYFPGLIALINSLVLTGHDYPIVVGDCGLTRDQQLVLRQYEKCRLFTLDPSMVINPQQYKAFAHLVGASGIVVLIDSDMIVTGDLHPIIAKARSGRICAYPNPIEDRWFAEWQQIFGLGQPPRRQVYICTGFVAFSVAHQPDLLARWWTACEAIYAHPTVYEGADWDGPTSQSDQDALNALLMSEYPLEALSLEPADDTVYRWDFCFLETVDSKTLSCRFRGRRPVILHASLSPKPWQTKGATRDTFFTFLQRLLLAPDLSIMPPAMLLSDVTRPGGVAYLRRYQRFVVNMGFGKFALSYCPQRLNELVRQAWRQTRQRLSRPRKGPTARQSKASGFAP